MRIRGLRRARRAGILGLPGLRVVGRVGGERLSLRAGELGLNLAVSELRETRDGGLEKLVEGRC